jgi:hypothetical protein
VNYSGADATIVECDYATLRRNPIDNPGIPVVEDSGQMDEEYPTR